METDRIITGDCRDVMADFDANSIHACVTDPPYGLAFMGRDWDDFEPREYQQWCEEWAREVKRVLRPGGHLLAFSGNRTHHRLFAGVEDAGFEIRDTITWHYGSGFPKALDVGKAIDKASDKERGTKRIETDGNVLFKNADRPWKRKANERGFHELPDDEPVTDAAKRWDGFKTALKPATEYVVVARKPLPGTVAECMQTHGTGALNIGETRLPTGDDLDRPEVDTSTWHGGKWGDIDGEKQTTTDNINKGHPNGRYPANVVFDETQAEALDREVGACPSDGIDFSDTVDNQNRDKYGEYNGERTQSYVYDDGHSGPSRYFYTSKASRAERTLDGKIDNAHPTVKPADLMEWLVKLVTAEEQIVLDPFAGSGTTCRAAKDLNRRFIGIEKQSKWADVARVRCGLTPDDPANVRSDAAQTGLESY